MEKETDIASSNDGEQQSGGGSIEHAEIGTDSGRRRKHALGEKDVLVGEDVNEGGSSKRSKVSGEELWFTGEERWSGSTVG